MVKNGSGYRNACAQMHTPERREPGGRRGGNLGTDAHAHARRGAFREPSGRNGIHLSKTGHTSTHMCTRTQRACKPEPREPTGDFGGKLRYDSRENTTHRSIAFFGADQSGHAVLRIEACMRWHLQGIAALAKDEHQYSNKFVDNLCSEPLETRLRT